MNLKQLSAFVLGALVATPVFAGPNGDATVDLTGASALRNNYFRALSDLCADASGSFTVFKEAASLSAFSNLMAAECSVPFSGTSITRVRINVSGGSLNSILGMTAVTAKQLDQLTLADCNATVQAGTGLLAGYSVRNNCVARTKVQSDGGFSDIEWQMAPNVVLGLTAGVDGFALGDVTGGSANIAQAFGVAVSPALYNALQTAQAANLPANCTTDNAIKFTPACQPSIGKAQMTALLAANENVGTKSNVSQIAPGASGPLTYCRRPDTSGTQTSANVYFLGSSCLTGSNGGEQFIIPGAAFAGSATRSLATYTTSDQTYYVDTGSGTGDVLNCLNGTSDPAANPSTFRFGIVSAENRAATTTTTWKFVKVNGAYISDGTASGMNRDTAINGQYDFFYEAVKYTGPSAITGSEEQALIDAMADKLGTPPSSGGADAIGLFPLGGGAFDAYATSDVGRFTRGGNSCTQPYAVDKF